MNNAITAEDIVEYPGIITVIYLNCYKRKLRTILEENCVTECSSTRDLFTKLGIPYPPTDFSKIREVLADELETTKRCVCNYFIELFLSMYSGLKRLEENEQYVIVPYISKEVNEKSSFENNRIDIRKLLLLNESEVASEVVAISFLKRYHENFKDISCAMSKIHSEVTCEIMRKLDISTPVDFSEIEETLKRVPFSARIYVEYYILGIILNLISCEILRDLCSYKLSQNSCGEILKMNDEEANLHVCRDYLKISRNDELLRNELFLNDFQNKANNVIETVESIENDLLLKTEYFLERSDGVKNIPADRLRNISFIRLRTFNTSGDFKKFLTLYPDFIKFLRRCDFFVRTDVDSYFSSPPENGKSISSVTAETENSSFPVQEEGTSIPSCIQPCTEGSPDCGYWCQKQALANEWYSTKGSIQEFCFGKKDFFADEEAIQVSLEYEREYTFEHPANLRLRLLMKLSVLTTTTKV
ncbi:hypothetical protein NPIL_298381 [Nephila pilipes]|uniref:Uncharacterized protein n=1 Tax=Nephila pilipes TaxID=299642 RepID=A0A8X6M9P3_NEPPI|nr:hypothetical protein NPIL_298381 [Nephila pilipes]